MVALRREEDEEFEEVIDERSAARLFKGYSEFAGMRYPDIDPFRGACDSARIRWTVKAQLVLASSSKDRERKPIRWRRNGERQQRRRESELRNHPEARLESDDSTPTQKSSKVGKTGVGITAVLGQGIS